MRPLLHCRIGYPVFSADDRTIVASETVGGRVGVGFFELLYGDYYRHLGHDLDINATWGYAGTLHRDGRIAVGSYHENADNAGGLQVFHLARRAAMGRIACGAVNTVRFDPTGSSLVTAGQGGILIWPGRIGEEAVRVGPPRRLLNDPSVEHFALSADGRRIATASAATRRLIVIDVEHVEQSKSFPIALTDARFAAISPDGKWAAASTWHGVGGEVWNIERGVLAAKMAIPPGAPVAFTPNGRWLVAKELDQLVLMHPGDWEVAHRVNIAIGNSLSGFSADGRLLAGADDRNVVRIIDLYTERELVAFESPEQNQASEYVFSPDGGTLAAFASRGAFLQLWDLRRIRATLASMNLDWDHPPLPPAPEAGPRNPLHLEADLGFLARPASAPSATAQP